MAKLTDAQIAQVAYNAGFRGDALVKAVAIALGESGGSTTQVYQPGGTSKEFSVGLWQINVGGYLADRLTRWGITWQDLQNPAVNAWAAYRLSQHGTNWTPWSVYNHGTYLQFMSRAQTAAAGVDTTVQPPDPNVIPASTNTTGGGLLGNVLPAGGFLDPIFDPIRFGFYFLIVMIVGLVILVVAFKSRNTGR